MGREISFWNRVPEIIYPNVISSEDSAKITRLRNEGRSPAGSAAQAIIDEAMEMARNNSARSRSSKSDRDLLDLKTKTLIASFMWPAIVILEAEQVIRGESYITDKVFLELYGGTDYSHTNLKKTPDYVLIGQANLEIHRQQYATILRLSGPSALIDFLVSSRMRDLQNTPVKFMPMATARKMALIAGKNRFIQLYSALGGLSSKSEDL
ncbi:MAG: hypothetical protein G01um10145_74 [Microgenomates group bacterium Gr01-1014_5]|nr:MAG: hypothetical protein G01um10145_74 [Microgenomates group bacterium Gr01-1014_5]